MPDTEIITRPAGVIAQLDRARHALAECRTDFERLRIRDNAKAVQEAARILERRDIQQQAARLVLDAEFAIKQANPPSQGRRNDLNFGNQKSEVKPRTLSHIRQSLPETKAELDTAADRIIERGDIPTRKAVREEIKPPHVSRNTGENEWYTPAHLIEDARHVLGRIDYDPASSGIANETVKADTYDTEKTDGLSKPWSGRVWMNPPYAQPLIRQFCDKLADEYEAGRVDQAVALVNNATETEWAQRLMALSDCICLLRGRVRFLDPDGKPGAPLQGQMVVGIGVSMERFRERFIERGIVFDASA